MSNPPIFTSIDLDQECDIAHPDLFVAGAAASFARLGISADEAAEAFAKMGIGVTVMEAAQAMTNTLRDYFARQGHAVTVHCNDGGVVIQNAWDARGAQIDRYPGETDDEFRSRLIDKLDAQDGYLPGERDLWAR